MTRFPHVLQTLASWTTGRITEDNVSNRSTELATPETDKMSTAPVPAVYNESVPTKTMVPDPGWFDGNRTKFEDW